MPIAPPLETRIRSILLVFRIIGCEFIVPKNLFASIFEFPIELQPGSPHDNSPVPSVVKTSPLFPSLFGSVYTMFDDCAEVLNVVELAPDGADIRNSGTPPVFVICKVRATVKRDAGLFSPMPILPDGSLRTLSIFFVFTISGKLFEVPSQLFAFAFVLPAKTHSVPWLRISSSLYLLFSTLNTTFPSVSFSTTRPFLPLSDIFPD